MAAKSATAGVFFCFVSASTQCFFAKSYHGGFSLRASYVFVIVSFLGQDFLTVDFALLLFGVVAVK